MGWYSRNKRILWVITIFVIAVGILTIISYCSSFDLYDKFDKTTFSQFLVAIGTLIAVLIALFINNINRYFERTDIRILNNKKYDKNFVYNSNYNVKYFLHLIIKNNNNRFLIKDCSIFLESQEINGQVIDIIRPFNFAGFDETTVLNIGYQYCIDFAFINIGFGNDISAILDLQIINFQEIKIDLLKYPKNSFEISAYSPSLKTNQKFIITIKLKNGFSAFIDGLKLIRDKYNKKHGNVNNIVDIIDEFEFAKFYDYVYIEIEDNKKKIKKNKGK